MTLRWPLSPRPAQVAVAAAQGEMAAAAARKQRDALATQVRRHGDVRQRPGAGCVPATSCGRSLSRTLGENAPLMRLRGLLALSARVVTFVAPSSLAPRHQNSCDLLPASGRG
jgi:hypothetical protein